MDVAPTLRDVTEERTAADAWTVSDRGHDVPVAVLPRVLHLYDRDVLPSSDTRPPFTA